VSTLQKFLPTALSTGADFCLEIKFEKHSDNPARVFRAMTSLIETCQRIDTALVQSVDVNIKPVLMLEDVETSSLRAWLKTALEAVEDDALKKVDWKPAVGKYLVKAKYYLIDFVSKNSTITNKAQVTDLSLKLLSASQETDAKHIPLYSRIPETELVRYLQELSEATSALQATDSAKYISAQDEAAFNLSFHVSPESVEDLLTKETIDSPPQVMILKVRRPDYLGESMWEFRFQNRTITAKIQDQEWLGRFQNRQVDVRPGDAIRAEVSIQVKYGYDGEAVGVKYFIFRVIGVIASEPLDASPGLFQ